MNFIVTTTINPPTKALIKFSKMENWKLIVVGDITTPKNLYQDLDCIYLDIEEQEVLNKELSDLIGFKSLERRNFGYIYAVKNGAKIIASIDDDNIPLSNWGNNVLIGQEVSVDHYLTDSIAFDPLSVTNINTLWHRGFPIELIKDKNSNLIKTKKNLVPKVQADLWNGDPDIDAICRIAYQPEVEIKPLNPYNSNKLSPFNTQNTFFYSEIMKYFMQLPFVGRMSDIWGSYLLQKELPEADIIYSEPTVYQDRNIHNLVEDLEKELIGYHHTYNFLEDKYTLPKKVLHAYNLYKNSF